MAITKSLLTIALEKAAETGVSRIHSIRLKIGALTGYVPEAVELNFKMLAADTIAAGAMLQIETVPLQCTCKKCDRSYRGKPDDFTCPDCGGVDITVTGGREMFIESMEVET